MRVKDEEDEASEAEDEASGNTVRHGYCDMKLDKVTRHNKADKG